MNIYLVVILVILLGRYVLEVAVEWLNVKCASPELPKEYEGFYDAEKYRKVQEYLKETTYFNLTRDTVFTGITVAFILAGGFNFVDRIARSLHQAHVVRGLIFFGILMLAHQIISVPFSAYRTFVIEEKFGFNRTTVKTFILDIVKTLTLGVILGGIVLSSVLWFFSVMGRWAWFYCWVGVTLFQLFLAFIAPVVIMPLFNKFIPLEEGKLKSAIEEYAKSQNFKMKGIFKMDASRRSTKSNAFFTGFGKYRRIALFDNLIQRHSVEELVSVLAHEIGHYKKKHFVKIMGLSIVTSGIMFFILSFFINNEGLFSAFKMEQTSIYASLFFFGFLYIPVGFVFSVLANFLSRHYEYEADDFAVKTYGKPQEFILALKKLTVDNLSNLTPHPLKVFLHYSHPPILKRIEVIRKINVSL